MTKKPEISSPADMTGNNRLLQMVTGLGGLLYGFDIGIIAGTIAYMDATFDLKAGQRDRDRTDAHKPLDFRNFGGFHLPFQVNGDDVSKPCPDFPGHAPFGQWNTVKHGYLTTAPARARI
jgi:hypothetical protein